MSYIQPTPIPHSGDTEVDNLMAVRVGLQQKTDTYKQIFNISLGVMSQDEAKRFICDLSNIEIENLNRTLTFLKSKRYLIGDFLNN
jgi:hypothetical protein